MRRKQRMRSISISKEVAFLEDQYDEVLVELISTTKVNWPKRSSATIYKDGLRIAIKELKEFVASVKKDLANVK